MYLRERKEKVGKQWVMLIVNNIEKICSAIKQIRNDEMKFYKCFEISDIDGNVIIVTLQKGLIDYNHRKGIEPYTELTEELNKKDLLIRVFVKKRGELKKSEDGIRISTETISLPLLPILLNKIMLKGFETELDKFLDTLVNVIVLAVKNNPEVAISNEPIGYIEHRLLSILSKKKLEFDH